MRLLVVCYFSLLYIVKQGGVRDYPILFVMREDKTISYIGDWERIQDLLDAESIDAETLNQYPDIMTLSKYFSSSVSSNKQLILPS